MTSKEPLTVSQILGILLMGVSLVGAMAALVVSEFHATPGTGLARVLRASWGWVAYLAVCGLLFLLLRWRVRKALTKTHKDKTDTHRFRN